MARPASRSQVIAFRCTPQEDNEIRERAHQHGYSISEYILRSALGQDFGPPRTEQRLQDLEDRIDRLERRAELSY